MSKKDIIANAYRELVVERHSTKIPVNVICQTCHLSRTTFYNYFKDVNDIIEYTLLNDAVIDNYYLMENSDIDNKTSTVNWYLSFLRHKKFYMVCMENEGQNSLFETVIDVLYEYNIRLFEVKFNYTSKQDLDYYAYKYL